MSNTDAGVYPAFDDVRPGSVYGSDFVAALFGVGVATVNHWAKDGKLKPLPRMSVRQPYRFLGAELLRLLGDQAVLINPPASETPTERRRRGEAAAKRVAELATGK